MKCLDCGKHCSEELEEAPIGSRYGWDLIERVVNLRKSGIKPVKLNQLLKIENQIILSNEAVRRIIKQYGPGTLDQ